MHVRWRPLLVEVTLIITLTVPSLTSCEEELLKAKQGGEKDVNNEGGGRENELRTEGIIRVVQEEKVNQSQSDILRKNLKYLTYILGDQKSDKSSDVHLEKYFTYNSNHLENYVENYNYSDSVGKYIDKMITRGDPDQSAVNNDENKSVYDNDERKSIIINLEEKLSNISGSFAGINNIDINNNVSANGGTLITSGNNGLEGSVNWIVAENDDYDNDKYSIDKYHNDKYLKGIRQKHPLIIKLNKRDTRSQDTLQGGGDSAVCSVEGAVCGSDGRTYSNECDLQFASAAYHLALVSFHRGTCNRELFRSLSDGPGEDTPSPVHHLRTLHQLAGLKYAQDHSLLQVVPDAPRHLPTAALHHLSYQDPKLHQLVLEGPSVTDGDTGVFSYCWNLKLRTIGECSSNSRCGGEQAPHFVPDIFQYKTSQPATNDAFSTINSFVNPPPGGFEESKPSAPLHTMPKPGSLRYLEHSVGSRMPKYLPTGCAYMHDAQLYLGPCCTNERLKGNHFSSSQLSRSPIAKDDVFSVDNVNPEKTEHGESTIFHDKIAENNQQHVESFAYVGPSNVGDNKKGSYPFNLEENIGGEIIPLKSLEVILYSGSSDDGILDRSHVMSRPFFDDRTVDRRPFQGDSINKILQSNHFGKVEKIKKKDGGYNWGSEEHDIYPGMPTHPPLPTHPPSMTDKPWWKPSVTTTSTPWGSLPPQKTTTQQSWWQPTTTQPTTTVPPPTTTSQLSWWPHKTDMTTVPSWLRPSGTTTTRRPVVDWWFPPSTTTSTTTITTTQRPTAPTTTRPAFVPPVRSLGSFQSTCSVGYSFTLRMRKRRSTETLLRTFDNDVTTKKYREIKTGANLQTVDDFVNYESTKRNTSSNSLIINYFLNELSSENGIRNPRALRSTMRRYGHVLAPSDLPNNQQQGLLSGEGQKENNDEFRVVGGSPAHAHAYPWLAALFNGHKQFCGGSLIDETHVLTAAHCIATMSGTELARLRVTVGAHNLHQHEASAQHFTVSRVVRHRNYDPVKLLNDVAVLTLSSAAKITQHVRPVCLNGGPESFVGQYGIVAGWGSLFEGGPQQGSLRQVLLKVVDNESCRKKYGSAAPGGVVPSYLCAGEGGRDSCSGDSGGPIVNNVGGVWRQLGVVSWGIGCGKGQFPGVYSRLSHFLPWISDVVTKF